MLMHTTLKQLNLVSKTLLPLLVWWDVVRRFFVLFLVSGAGGGADGLSEGLIQMI